MNLVLKHPSKKLLLVFLVGAFASCKSPASFNYLTYTNTANEIEQMEVKMDKLYAMFLGHFDNQEQASNTDSPILKEQELIAVPIWRKRKGEYWFYSGWYKVGFRERALSENIYQLQKLDRDVFELIVYAMPTDKTYSMEWKQEKPFAQLKPADLVEVCKLQINHKGGNDFELTSPNGNCKQSFTSNIQSIDYQILLTPNRQQHFSIMYDKNDKAVLQYPRPDGIMFNRLDKKVADSN